MFKEDLAPFFSDFGVSASFEGEAGQVLFDAPSQIDAGGMVISDDYRITYETGLFAALAHEDRISLDGGSARPDITGIYSVTAPPMKIQDGRVTEALLARVE